MRTHLLVLVALVAAVFGLVSPARAVEHTFAGSAQIDYLAVPTAPGGDANAGTGNTLDGFTMEAGLKVAADISDHLSANVKVCYGCHGFELDMAYFDLRVADELNFRVGRFSPSFGAFNLRHDPANQKLSDKPLPYDMGRMLRNTGWGMSILPSPFPDNGAEIDGTHWFGTKAQLDYAVYAVAGFRNTDTNPLDLNFPLSHTYPYALYVDDNARPTGGARLSLTLKPAPSSDLTLGASGMGGTYDNNNQLYYVILGADASLRIRHTSLRAEYLMRRTDFSVADPTLLKYVPAPTDGNYFTKQGAYLELEQPIVRDFDVIARVDGMLRTGNVAADSPLTNHSWMARETLGLAYGIERNLRLKGSVEYYQFSEGDTFHAATGTDSGNLRDVAVHLGVTGSF
jgi:hypothetical protein